MFHQKACSRGFSLSMLKGFFPASSGIQSQNPFGVEDAGNNLLVLSGIQENNPPRFQSSFIGSGVTRSRSVQILDF